MTDDLHTIQQQVLSRVRAGEVRMRSRAYFLLRLIATIVVALVALSVSSFIISFIVFSIHVSGQQFLLGFGWQGVATFLTLFPWLHLAFDVALILLLEWLLQGFKWGYRFSLVSIFVSVFALSALLGFLLGLTPLHSMLLDDADRGGAPLGGMYEHIRDPHHEQGIFRGTVISAAPDGTLVVGHDDLDHDPDDGTWTVHLPPNMTPPQPGDRVFIFGTSTGDTIQAYNEEPLSPEQ